MAMPTVPDVLTRTFSSDAGVSVWTLVVRESVALGLGLVVALVYRLTHGRRAAQAVPMMATLVLLTVLIGMISSVIGDNIARAFSLVGALAIVRFRTVVEDTRDTAFVIFAVGVGMAVGAGYLKVPLVCIPVAAAAAFMFRPFDAKRSGGGRAFTLVVRVGVGHAGEEVVRGAFDAHLDSWDLVGVSTARQGASFEKTYSVRLRTGSNAVDLVTRLNGVEGVQGVELREVAG